MRVAVPVLVFVLVALAAGLRAGHADGEAPSWSELQKQHRKAFKALALLPLSKAEKQIVPRLPEGIVIESGPFDRLIGSLLALHEPQLALRESVLGSLAGYPTPQAGKAVVAAFKTLAKEEGELLKRIQESQEGYAQVFNRGYMDLGETDRRTRKLAAVFIPFHRTLLAHLEALRGRATNALAEMKAGEALDWLQTAARRERDASVRAACALALGRIGGAPALATLTEAAARDPTARVRVAALLALTAWPVREMKGAVPAALADPSWQVRALAVAMCVRARLVEAAPALVAALADEPGRLRKDIDDALFALVGARMYGDVALWRRWLDENRAPLEEKTRALAASGAYDAPLGPIEDWPRDEAGAGAADEKRGGTTVFYGIPTLSKRIVYVVDISRSMQDEAGAEPPRQGDERAPYARPSGSSKMAIARWQLHRAVHELPDDAWFDVIVYSESYMRWQPQMMQAGRRAKAKAHAFIDSLNANGTTNICDALDEALAIAGAAFAGEAVATAELAADTIFLLSDGDPNRGRVTQLPRLLDEFVGRNLRTRLVVHTVGIGEAAGSSFLEDLARRTGGRYVGFR